MAAPKNSKPVAKKADAKKAVKPTKVVAKRQRKAYTRPQFRRPHTYRKPQQPKPSNNTKSIKDPWDQFRVVRKPLATDVAMKKIEDNNTLTFLVDPRATKTQIKHAVRALYQVKVAKVNTLIRPQGDKKAYVRLAPAHDALDVANKIGVL
jgi:large subunit ribosomal protein L23Ae